MTAGTAAATTTTPTGSSSSLNLEQWDLTPSVSPYLDRHLIFPLLEYLDTLIDKTNNNSGDNSDMAPIIDYSKQDVAAARLALLRPTCMVDYALDVCKSLEQQQNDDALLKELQDKKENVYKELEELRQGCAPLDKLCKDTEEKTKLINLGQWNVAHLVALGIPEEMVETYRKLARFEYDCGDYQSARDMLTNYISLFAKPPRTNVSGGAAEQEDDDLLMATSTTATTTQATPSSSSSPTDIGNASMYYLPTNDVDSKMLQVLWGRLACDILVEDWEAASIAVEAVKTAMESMASNQQITPLEALQQRTWLLHWALFVYWNVDNQSGVPFGLEQLIDLFHSERYKQAITTNAPHLLRYLTAAVLLCKRRVVKKAATVEARRLMRNLISVMNDCEYTDPIVEFVNCLCVKFDFDSAQTKLAECERVLSADFFLCRQTDLFMEEARVFVFENYCRIHNKIDLRTLGEKLAMDQDQAERWIVDLIRNADLDAKIDSEEGCVVMGGTPQSIYEQVMERTRDLNVRSATLAQNLNNVLNEARKEKAKKEKAAREDY